MFTHKLLILTIIITNTFVYIHTDAYKLGAIKCNSDGTMAFPVDRLAISPGLLFGGTTFTIEAYSNYSNQMSRLNVDLEIKIVCTSIIAAYSVTNYVSVPGSLKTACFIAPDAATCNISYTTTTDYVNNCNAYLPNRGFIYTDLITVKAYNVANCGSSTGTVTVINPQDNPVNVRVISSAVNPVSVTMVNNPAPGAPLPGFNLGGILPEFPSLPVTLGNMVPGFSLPTTTVVSGETGSLSNEGWYKILIRNRNIIIIGFDVQAGAEVVVPNNRITALLSRSLQILLSPADFGILIPFIITIIDNTGPNTIQCWCYASHFNCSDGLFKVIRNNLLLTAGSTVSVAQPAGSTSLTDNVLLGYFALMNAPLQNEHIPTFY